MKKLTDSDAYLTHGPKSFRDDLWEKAFLNTESKRVLYASVQEIKRTFPMGFYRYRGQSKISQKGMGTGNEC